MVRCGETDVFDLVRGGRLLSRWVQGGLFMGVAAAMSGGT